MEFGMVLEHGDVKIEAEEQVNASTSADSNNKEVEKLAQIAEVMELLEETHKNKDWLLDQIKQNRIKAPLKPTMSLVGILKACPANFISHLLDIMNLNELEEFEGPPPLTVTYHWFFTDIVAGSDPTITTNEQARKIIVLNQLIDRTEVFRQRDPESTLVLPTGDGMAIGFSDSPEKPLRLALEVHKNLSRYNNLKRIEKEKLLIRIGIDTGPVYMIKDLNGKENVWGPGIIMARRVMDLAREMNIIASARIANDIRTLRPEYRSILHPIGDYSIKHGEKILIYNAYGDGFGNKKSPQGEKVQKSAALEENQKTVSRFNYSSIAVTLDIKNPLTMLTHHTLLWGFVNISNEPIDRVFYYLDGDVPRNFPDMNVVVKDEDEKELDIMSLNVNKPYHKEFYVKLRKPIKPQEKRRFTKLEYDWEEPDRHYVYTVASNCKKFDYSMFAPKGIEVNQKVLTIDPMTGDKRYAPVHASVKYLDNGTQITWSGTDLRAHDTYRFDW
jgi:hypothetical protein